MKPFIHGKWHAWDPGNPFRKGCILLSDEDTKHLRSMDGVGEVLKFLSTVDPDAAKVFQEHIQG